MQYAIGIDPGGVTGMALIGCDEDGMFSVARWDQVDSRDRGEERASFEIARTILDWLDEFRVDVLVFEDFIIRSRVTDRSLLSPVRITAKVETYLEIYKDMRVPALPPVKFQSAANAKTIATDTRLKHWDLWLPGKQHARDAIRHAVLALRGL